jgi:hypothetical protein
MRSGRLADPLDESARELDRLTRKRFKTPADHEEIARVEWSAGLWLECGEPCVPGDAIEACFLAAARTRRLGKLAQAGFVCPGNPRLLYPGPRNIEGLWAEPRFRLRKPVQVAGRRTVRTRPRFPEWSLEFEVQFLPGLLDGDQVLEIFRIAGTRTGLGDWRPKFGRFSADRPG